MLSYNRDAAKYWQDKRQTRGNAVFTGGTSVAGESVSQGRQSLHLDDVCHPSAPSLHLIHTLPFAEPPQLASETSFIKPVFFFATCFPKHPLGWRTLRLLDHGHLAPPLHSNLFLEPCPGWSSLTSPAGRPPWNVLSASVGGIALIPCRCVTKCDKFKMICWR